MISTACINQSNVLLKYWFDSIYMDYCHPNNPNCVTGVTCSNCNDPENPRYHVAANMITYSNSMPIGIPEISTFNFSVIPNPAADQITISCEGQQGSASSIISIYNANGRLMDSFSWNGEKRMLSLKNFSPGLYIFRLVKGNNICSQKVIIQ